MSKFSLKNIFLKEELTTKGFGKHGEKFPKSDEKGNPLKHATEKDIDKAVDVLGEDELTTKPFGKHGEKFPKSDEKGNPLKHASEEDIDKALSDLEEELNVKPFGKHGEKFPKSDEKGNPLKHASEEDIDKAVDTLGESEEFDDAFEKYQQGEGEDELNKLDEPFSDNLEECGCGDVDPTTDGLSAKVLPDDHEDEYGPTEFVVLTVGPQDDGINFKAPGLPKLEENDQK